MSYNKIRNLIKDSDRLTEQEKQKCLKEIETVIRNKKLKEATSISSDKEFNTERGIISAFLFIHMPSGLGFWYDIYYKMK